MLQVVLKMHLSTKAGRGSSEIQVRLGYGYEMHRTMLSHLKILLLMERKKAERR